MVKFIILGGKLNSSDLQKVPIHTFVSLFKINFAHKEIVLTFHGMHVMNTFLCNQGIIISTFVWKKVVLKMTNKIL